MTSEQINTIRIAIKSMISTCNDLEAMLSDFEKCESEISRKYLAAAIKKHSVQIPGVVQVMAEDSQK